MTLPGDSMYLVQGIPGAPSHYRSLSIACPRQIRHSLSISVGDIANKLLIAWLGLSQSTLIQR
jgi:hypothetical protein